jgi:hypothetical protein
MGGGDSLAVLSVQVRRALIWLAVGAAAIFVANLLVGVGSLIVVLIVGTLWIALAGDAVAGAWQGREQGPAVAVTLVPIGIAGLAMVLALSPIFYWSNVVPSWWLLRSQRAAFERAVTGGSAPDGISVQRAGGRTAFHTVNGMLGAWRGIVHDPTGRLAEARGRGGRPIPRDVRYLFGSETRWCQRLDGAWFHCHFD